MSRCLNPDTGTGEAGTCDTTNSSEDQDAPDVEAMVNGDDNGDEASDEADQHQQQ